MEVLLINATVQHHILNEVILALTLNIDVGEFVGLNDIPAERQGETRV